VANALPAFYFGLAYSAYQRKPSAKQIHRTWAFCFAKPPLTKNRVFAVHRVFSSKGTVYKTKKNEE